MIGKKWIYLDRNTFHRQCGPSQKVRAARTCFWQTLCKMLHTHFPLMKQISKADYLITILCMRKLRSLEFPPATECMDRILTQVCASVFASVLLSFKSCLWSVSLVHDNLNHIWTFFTGWLLPFGLCVYCLVFRAKLQCYFFQGFSYLGSSGGANGKESA